MQTVSEAYKTAITSLYRTLADKVTLQTSDGETYELGAGDIVSGSLSITGSCLDNGFELGSTTAQDCSVTLNNENGRWNGKNLDMAVLAAYSGIVLPDNSTEYVKLGTFIVDEPGIPYDQLELQCSDKMILLDEEFQYVSITYPATNYEILLAIADHCGIALAASVAEKDNMDYIVNAAPDDTSLTCRDIAGMIAMMAAGFSRTNRDGELDIVTFPALIAEDTVEPVWSDTYLLDGSGDNFEIGGAAFDAVFGYQGTAYEMPYGSRVSFKQTSDLTVISGVAYAYLDDNDAQQVMIYGTDAYLVEIPECPLLKHDISTVIEGIYNKVVGLAYFGFEADYPGNPALDPGDAVRHTIRDGRQIVSMIGEHKFTHGGTCTMTATAPSRTAKAYKGKISRQIDSLTTQVASTVKQGQKYYGVSTSREKGIEVTGGGALDGISAIFNSDAMGWFDTGGNFVGGMTFFNSIVSMIAGVLTNDINSDFYATVGDTVIDGTTYKGILGYRKSFSLTDPFFKIVTFTGSYAESQKHLDIWLLDKVRLHIAYSPTSGWRMIDIHVDNGTMWVGVDLDITDASEVTCELGYGVSGSSRTNCLGVDADGVYKVVNFVKTYL